LDLQEFIKETLVQISRGVSLANDELSPKRIKADGSPLPKLFVLRPGGQDSHAGVLFDVAITTQTDSSTKGGGKIKLAVFEADLAGKEVSSNTHVSRVSFSVNVNQWHG